MLGKGGGYFGYWCVEAAAAVKAFGLDDHLCIGHPNYPRDLLRPDKSSPSIEKEDTMTEPEIQPIVMLPPKKSRSWRSSIFHVLSRWFH